MPLAVIVVRRPKPGTAQEMRRLVVFEHYEFLRMRGYVSDKRPFVLESTFGDVIEIFEWKSRDAQRAALKDPDIKELRDRLAPLCDPVPLSDISEASSKVAHFDSISEIIGEGA